MTAVRLVVPCKTPLPALRLAVTTVELSLERRFPNWSSIRMTGCWANAAPAVAVEEGCVWTARVLAAAGLTTKLLEVAPVKPPVLKSMVRFSALLYERLVKVTTPLTAVRLLVPCREAVPRLRVAETTVLLSLLHKLPNASSIRTTGWFAKAVPAVAVVEGCV